MYNSSMNTKGFKIGDKCAVSLDWGSGAHRGKRVQIRKFQTNGNQVFAIVMWLGLKARELEAEYGTLIHTDELKKVAK